MNVIHIGKVVRCTEGGTGANVTPNRPMAWMFGGDCLVFLIRPSQPGEAGISRGAHACFAPLAGPVLGRLELCSTGPKGWLRSISNKLECAWPVTASAPADHPIQVGCPAGRWSQRAFRIEQRRRQRALFTAQLRPHQAGCNPRRSTKDVVLLGKGSLK